MSTNKKQCKTCGGSGCPFPEHREMCGVHHCPDCLPKPIKVQVTRYKFLVAEMEHAIAYADAGEHQDGEEFWNEFDTVDEAVADFQLYLHDTIA